MSNKGRRRGSRSVEFLYCLDDDTELEIEAQVSFGHPGRTSGPPELCVAPEGDEVEIQEIWELVYVPSKEPRYTSSAATFPVPPENAGLIPSNRRGKHVRWRRRDDLEKNPPKELLEALQDQAVESAVEDEDAAYDDYVDRQIDEWKERNL